MLQKANTWPKSICECGVLKKLLTSHVFLTVFILPTHKNPLHFPFIFFKQAMLPLKTICALFSYPIRPGALKVSPLKGFSCGASAPCVRAAFPSTAAAAGVLLMWDLPAQWCRKQAPRGGFSSQRCNIPFWFCCLVVLGFFLNPILCTDPSCPSTSCTQMPSHPQNTPPSRLK